MSSAPPDFPNWDFEQLRRGLENLQQELKAKPSSRKASKSRLSTLKSDQARAEVQKQLDKICSSPLDPNRRPSSDGLDEAMVMPMRKLHKTINEQLLAPTDDTRDLVCADLKALIQAVNPNHPALKGEKPMAAADEQTVGDEQPEETE
ncbi:hypothetical protein LTR12_013480 [Friedmanniomyces endolithicus]|nr:hypothetical protein LTR74_006131 [Friedmanniomyces endolithicus]KAK1812147.1 hypothetical protein LTR12_013480 [Friedmanniomyces endolithicus]